LVAAQEYCATAFGMFIRTLKDVDPRYYRIITKQDPYKEIAVADTAEGILNLFNCLDAIIKIRKLESKDHPNDKLLALVEQLKHSDPDTLLGDRSILGDSDEI